MWANIARSVESRYSRRELDPMKEQITRPFADFLPSFMNRIVFIGFASSIASNASSQDKLSFSRGDDSFPKKKKNNFSFVENPWHDGYNVFIIYLYDFISMFNSGGI